ncbi:MAG TPA: MBL fold metallo-hydrolase [Acidimicrobiia bacterium]|jgi:glyoxylase-like metal-dependent hydrolase (beta-lactamase superfamily II)|nr:MBL fold metallo-hydrolase [Acidimicrobiia bacterium]
MSTLWHFETDAYRIRKLCVGAYENNAYVVACRQTGAAVIVDAAAEPETIMAATVGLAPQAILTTHGHFDHVGAAQQVSETLGVPFLLHPADEALAQMRADGPVGEGPIGVGDVTITAVPTPGHTLGSTCFLLPGVALTGDTLFPGGPGATVSPGSSFEQIISSIEDNLMVLADDTIVMPGHGLDTTIGTERPALPDWVDRGW